MGSTPIGAGRRALRLPVQLCPFALFLCSRVHRTDAEGRLPPEQIEPMNGEAPSAGLTPIAGSS